MTFEIFVLLVQDAIGTGAIYVLMALGIVLIFNVTRVIFVSYGDLVAYSALTLGSFELGRMPGTVWLVLTLAGLAFLVEAGSLIRQKRLSLIPKAFLTWVIVPAIPVAVCFMVGAKDLSLPVAMALTIALVLPLGPLLYRVVFQPIATAPVLVLLMVAVALHFAITGLALLYFGPEGLRTEAFVTGDVTIGGWPIPQQLIVIVECGGASSRSSCSAFSNSPSRARRCARLRSTARAQGLSASGPRAPGRCRFCSRPRSLRLPAS